MKKITYIVLSFAAAAVLASCEKKIEVTPENDVQFVVTATLDEPTKATLSESAGAFAFSSGDQIAVCNDGSIWTGTTTSTSKTGTFSMPEYFDASINGIAGFPASLVSTMTPSSVTFTLPTSYAYTEVGDADPNAAKVVAPMIGTYTAGNSIALKHAGAVVRIRLTNLAAGSVSITFPTYVTGTCTLDAIPSASGEGILAASLSTAGKTVTITGVPAVADESYVYVTLPVPTGTAPHDIMVTNEPANADPSRMVAITGSGSGLNRAAGWKLSARPAPIASPKFKVGESTYVVLAPGNLMAKLPDGYTGETYASAAEWKFGGYFETIGAATSAGNYLFANYSAEAAGKWIDLFEWQGNSATTKSHGIVACADYDAKYHGDDENETLYSGCWDGLTITNGGGYDWRPMTSGEWAYLLNSRTGANINGDPGWRCARATVAGTKGLLIFPDSDVDIWEDGSMGDVPGEKNPYGDKILYNYESTYTSANMINMAQVGIVFLPVSGTREGVEITLPEDGRYWSSNGATLADPTQKGAIRLGFSKTIVKYDNDRPRQHGCAVRLVREVDPM